MSRRHDSRDRDVQRRRRDEDDHHNDRDRRDKHREHHRDQPPQRHGHSSQQSTQQSSRHHQTTNPEHQQRRERDDYRREPIKREHNNDTTRSPDTKAKRHRNRYANEEADSGQHEWGKPSDRATTLKAEDAAAAAAAPVEKEQPNFGLSGKLTEDTNKVNGIVLKYSEPDEARKPKRRWRLYPFKGTEALATLFIHRQSCFLIGRDRKICDIPVDHPSCSKQHAVLQYRLVGYQREDGTKGKRVRPYVLDLESANGTYLNNQRIDAKKYVEVLEKDVLKFGYSSREYVMLHENSKDEEEDDDVMEEVEPPVAATK